MQKTNKLDSVFPGIIIVLYGIIESAKYFQFITEDLANQTGVVLGTLGIVFIVIRKGLKTIKHEVLVFFIYTLGGLLSNLYNDNIDLKELLWPFFFWGIASLLNCFKINPIFGRLSYNIFAVSAIYNLLFVGGGYFSVETSESRNYCSAYLLSLLSIYIICKEKNGEKTIPFLEISLFLFISILSLGRGGIVSSILLLVLCSIYQIFHIKEFRIKSMFIGILVASIIIYGVLSSPGMYDYITGYIDYSTEFFEERGMNSSRSDIWGQYINQIMSTPMSLFLAPPIAGTSLLNQYSFNLHNSFLMLYARYGTIVFLLITFLLFRAFRSFYRKRAFLLLILFVTVCVRISTDVIAFNGVMDITVFFFIFYPFHNNSLYIKKTR